jgi:hypothetical protein
VLSALRLLPYDWPTLQRLQELQAVSLIYNFAVHNEARILAANHSSYEGFRIFDHNFGRDNHNLAFDPYLCVTASGNNDAF